MSITPSKVPVVALAAVVLSAVPPFFHSPADGSQNCRVGSASVLLAVPSTMTFWPLP